MANALRGEVDFHVGEKTYLLRLSLGDHKALQQATGIPTLAWGKLLEERKIGAVEVDAILTLALRSGDKERFRRAADIAEVMEEAGSSACTNAALEVLMTSLTDPRDRQPKSEENGDRPL